MKDYILRITLLLVIINLITYVQAQTPPQVPAIYSNIHYDDSGKLYFDYEGVKYFAEEENTKFNLQQLYGNPKGTETGVILDFGNIKGSISYGLIPYGKVEHPLPVFRFLKPIEDGKVEINVVKDFKYPYDFVDWKINKYLTIGYRLIDESGMILYDGEVSLSGTSPFTVNSSISEGPFVSKQTSTGITIWCSTTSQVKASVIVNGEKYEDSEPSLYHEWEITNLSPNSEYNYQVNYGDLSQEYKFKTAPEEGSREAFVFAYTSDSRHANGGGERKIYGANAYIMKKMAALAYSNDAAFFQFSGDMIDGYLSSSQEQEVQYSNWKKSVESFWHYMPFYIAMGNHESLIHLFKYENSNRNAAAIDRFPFETNSSESLFRDVFANPTSSLISEDNNKYDPNPSQQDFPSYQESVYSYKYGNVAMIVLNSDYWYAPSLSDRTETSGGLHGYIMDNQLEWLKNTVEALEKDENIDHVFVTQHTPAFPNGGHSGDDMWYNGDNGNRPYINGKPVEKGIIERRDEYLDILINKSSKVVAILTGDEHNYNWLKLTKDVPIYPEGYEHEKLNVSRPIYQINNGAAGAPYYGQEVLPWSEHTQSFSVENALCLFYVEGNSIIMKVLNPDTLNEIDSVKLK